MRKRTISLAPETARPTSEEWLPLDQLADVEITSEDSAHPIEHALLVPVRGGWQAATSGSQTIRVHFHRPLELRRVRLVFRETTRTRTQEFVLRASSDGGLSYREIVRQQFNFSPGGASHQEEEYRLTLPTATALELTIIPDVSGGEARATLEELRVA